MSLLYAKSSGLVLVMFFLTLFITWSALAQVTTFCQNGVLSEPSDALAKRYSEECGGIGLYVEKGTDNKNVSISKIETYFKDYFSKNGVNGRAFVKEYSGENTLYTPSVGGDADWGRMTMDDLKKKMPVILFAQERTTWTVEDHRRELNKFADHLERKATLMEGDLEFLRKIHGKNQMSVLVYKGTKPPTKTDQELIGRWETGFSDDWDINGEIFIQLASEIGLDIEDHLVGIYVADSLIVEHMTFENLLNNKSLYEGKTPLQYAVDAQRAFEGKKPKFKYKREK